ncbi:N-acetyl-gamma-glutamyl-phosphate reductase [Pseudorhodobacter turbinis]|uniref:N-acetyl-gamma-glutamyl-phosphate reductase n=1 Tax=Pseudorhodobacter turbinis TaxID=2500533 RepID=A0A4P8EHH9_9RHOB|nr:N-acetyl-gamma-glutamyl-phosphate reductase [Pseudorhodobacter turbinis]QCO56025.1 N-acetyl-gamma-glutamyl-phosphate reductase [Pseudorhodobacter turbinis]
MAAKVFIDGEVGTTGLQIRDRLVGRADIALISLPEDRRKDAGARAEAFAQADLAILCLPDDAAIEAAAICATLPTRLIDASTAHRVNPDWVFGFAEMAAGQRAAIAGAKRVSNPGCYSTCAIALLRPLVEAGLVSGEADLSIFGISGYSGGGKAMIAEFEKGEANGAFLYATGQKHKHMPEVMAYGKLSRAPVFVPAVGQYAQGMIVQIPVFDVDAGAVHAALQAHYAGSQFISVRPLDQVQPRENPQALNNTNKLELSVLGDSGHVVVSAILDNLGKGASGAAVQNLNIMLGLDEGAGL